ncbi:ATP-dependent RNA helicase DHX8 [Morchella snyderi]|nr:ATP-dependent RNA helicase DHX8 [Morchella snyderi]
MSTTTPTTSTETPYRQIRALYDADTITVYQAYQSSIALPAVASQKLSASPDFSFDRMTWIKPSWTWMMYRSGYSYKSERQAHILALKVKREGFEKLLQNASVAWKERKEVRVQWDPERTVALQKLPYRSIQVGVGRGTVKEWVEEMIVGIEDVTERAREMKKLIDEGKIEEAKKLVPEEKEYVLSEELREELSMNTTKEDADQWKLEHGKESSH